MQKKIALRMFIVCLVLNISCYAYGMFTTGVRLGIGICYGQYMATCARVGVQACVKNRATPYEKNLHGANPLLNQTSIPLRGDEMPVGLYGEFWGDELSVEKLDIKIPEKSTRGNTQKIEVLAKQAGVSKKNQRYTNLERILDKIKSYRAQFDKDKPIIFSGVMAQHDFDVLCLMRLTESRHEAMEAGDNDRARKYENMVIALLRRRIDDPAYCKQNATGARAKLVDLCDRSLLHKVIRYCIGCVKKIDKPAPSVGYDGNISSLSKPELGLMHEPEPDVVIGC